MILSQTSAGRLIFPEDHARENLHAIAEVKRSLD